MVFSRWRWQVLVCLLSVELNAANLKDARQCASDSAVVGSRPSENGLAPPWVLLQGTALKSRKAQASQEALNADSKQAVQHVHLHSATAEAIHGSASSLKADVIASNDLMNLFSSLLWSGTILLAHLLFFGFVRLRYSKLYCQGWLYRKVPLSPGTGMFHWARASWKLRPEDAIEAAGLDVAMALMFQEFAMRILMVIGVPIVLIMCPLHYFYGGGSETEPLSRIDITNVEDSSWLLWVHAVLVWVVTVAVQRMMVSAQIRFTTLRYEWLRKMALSRATTCLVQNIPPELCSDKKLCSYVDKMFMRDAVLSAYVVRKLPDHLSALIDALHFNQEQLKDTEQRWALTSNDPEQRPKFMATTCEEVDSIDHYTDLVRIVTASVRTEQDRIHQDVEAEDPDVFSYQGFVTFKRRHDRELALGMRVRSNLDEIVFSVPPDPIDVRWDVLQQEIGSLERKTGTIVMLLSILYFSYLPIMIIISLITRLETLRNMFPAFDVVVVNYPVLTSLWDGVVGPLALTVVISFVPAFLMFIIRRCSGLPSERACQYQLQHWYFYFQVTFVLFIFGSGSSVFSTYLRLANNPNRIFHMIASTLPSTAHFYLSFVPFQWVMHIVAICRYGVLLKYFMYRRHHSDNSAYNLAEPEDQDYHGIGARSANQSMMLVLALVFCTVSPSISLLALIDFFLCRLVSGYLLVFAETVKADTGGEFWNTQLQHVHQGIFLYISLMVAILCEKSGAYGPGLLAASSYLYMLDSHHRFDTNHQWARLPFEEVAELDKTIDSDFAKVAGQYIQPELLATT